MSGRLPIRLPDCLVPAVRQVEVAEAVVSPVVLGAAALLPEAAQEGNGNW